MNNRIKELRQIKHLSQKEFGETLNLSQNHISSIEKGVRTVTDRTINDICDKYNVNKKWLLTGQGEIFKDVLEGFNLDNSEVEEFIRLFYEVDSETREYVLGLMQKTLKK
ncbi:helix-turn-helix family protein [Clostridioides difficile CD149]|uniref:helix-turn-helix domain-containing protein n=1 Tax=Clostridioides difficile TaxID=1496 RepID=UPI00016C5E88|nr:helix-turn-helix transcriptional regulator [Clostridioides difficile]OFU26186.1 transcriptional regulator [Clostridium sp. HMSC19B12]EGT3653521.1 XRE family transcriptional regulator [Clostridioides difficile]EGT3696627.1 XRE family transcriptional regulator [Clostridioides difficile]EGT3962354.1 XRE family transcriptional regulator [Clostridioides difficile]EGT4211651.1 XRE family transcriptional regulator [Clostridioides difficile]